MATVLSSAPPVVVTCVHGTWARGQRWPELEAAITAAMSDVTFRYFDWRGRNLLATRAGAALRLREWLRQDVVRTPGTRHLIVAHSHGANIVLHALKGASPDVREAVIGVAMLSPPLLTCELADDPRYVARRVIVGAWVGLMIVVAFLPLLARWFGFTVQSGLMAAAAVTPAWLVALWPWRVCRRARTLAERLVLPAIDIPGLIVRAPADEATIFLALASACCGFARKARTRFLRPRGFTDADERRLREAETVPDAMVAIIRAAGLPAITFSLGLAMLVAARDGQWLVALGCGVVLVHFGVDTLAVIPGSLWLLPLMVGSWLPLLAFGILPTPAAALLTVSLDSAPGTRWRVIELPASSVLRQGGWQHSTPVNPAAIAAIGSWVRGCCR